MKFSRLSASFRNLLLYTSFHDDDDYDDAMLLACLLLVIYFLYNECNLFDSTSASFLDECGDEYTSLYHHSSVVHFLFRLLSTFFCSKQQQPFQLIEMSKKMKRKMQINSTRSVMKQEENLGRQIDLCT